MKSSCIYLLMSECKSDCSHFSCFREKMFHNMPLCLWTFFQTSYDASRVLPITLMASTYFMAIFIYSHTLCSFPVTCESWTIILFIFVQLLGYNYNVTSSLVLLWHVICDHRFIVLCDQRFIIIPWLIWFIP